MTDAGASLIPIFATPFGSVSLDLPANTNKDLLELFESRATAQYCDKQAASSDLFFRSCDNLFDWPELPVQTLKRHMLSGAAAIVAATNTYSESEFNDLRLQARAWFSLLRPNGAIPVASYFGASWCAIYCVAAPELQSERQDSGMLRLYESRLSTSFIDASTWRMRPPFNHGHHTWRPAVGHMAVFPAAIPHEIALLRATGSLVLVTVRLRFATPTQESLPAW